MSSLDALVSVGYGLTIACMVNVLVSWVFVAWFRNKMIVFIAQPKMLQLLCLSALLIQISLILYIILGFPTEENLETLNFNQFCKAEFWTRWLGVMSMLSILMLKLFFVYRATQSLDRAIFLTRHVLPFFVLVVMLAIYGNIAIQVVFPPDYTLLQLPGGDEIGPHGDCYPSGTVGKSAVFIAKVCMELPFDIAIVLFAYKLRNVNEEVGESRRIFRLAVFNVVVYALHWALYLSSGAVLGLDAEGEIFAACFLHILAYNLHALSVVLFLVIPRMYCVWYEYRYGQLPEFVNIGSLGDRSHSDSTISRSGLGGRNVNLSDEERKEEIEAAVVGDEEDSSELEASERELTQSTHRSEELEVSKSMSFGEPSKEFSMKLEEIEEDSSVMEESSYDDLEVSFGFGTGRE